MVIGRIADGLSAPKGGRADDEKELRVDEANDEEEIGEISGRADEENEHPTLDGETHGGEGGEENLLQDDG